MYQKLNVPTLGVIENMSYFVCPDCRRESDIFGGAARRRSRRTWPCRSLGGIPLYEPIRRGGDDGIPIVVGEPESVPAKAFLAVAERAAAQISIASYRTPIPLTPVQ